MKKETIEIFRYKGLPKGYGFVSNHTPSDADILNKIVEFSRNKKITIYRHILWKEWIENKEYSPTEFTKIPIPKGDEVWFLDIYYQ